MWAKSKIQVYLNLIRNVCLICRLNNPDIVLSGLLIKIQGFFFSRTPPVENEKCLY